MTSQELTLAYAKANAEAKKAKTAWDIAAAAAVLAEGVYMEAVVDIDKAKKALLSPAEDGWT